LVTTVKNAPQRGKPLADQVLVRGKSVVGQGFPVGKQRAAQRGGEKGNFFQQALRIRCAGAHHRHRFANCFFTLSELG
jgi:hypothetical protein